MPRPPASQKWYPPTGEAGARLINDRRRYMLVTGPRKSGKTFAICQKAAVHLYSVPKAEVCFLVKRKKAGESGAWNDLTRHVVENSFQSDGRILPWVRRPSVSSNTKHTMCSVRNAYGGTGHAHLWSLFRDSEVEQVFKNTRFTMVYVCEADQFSSASLFRAMADQLRVPGVPYDSHQLIMDCNPPEEGMDHWLAKVFPVDPDDWEFSGEADSESGEEYRNQFAVHRFTLDDNPFLSRKEKMDIINAYKNDPDKYRRYVLGEWIRSSKGTIFEQAFQPSVHVIGFENPAIPQDQWDVLVPARGAYQLATGWDLGQTSHAIEFGAVRAKGKQVAVDLIDEVVSIDMEISLDEIVRMVMEKMDQWEKLLQERGANGPIEWFHWSDSSAFNYAARSDSSEAGLVLQYSDNRIALRRAIKGSGSVLAGVGMMQRMFGDGQLFVSPRCSRLITAIKSLKDGDLSAARRYSGARRRHVHPLDAARYMITHEVPRAMTDLASMSRDGESASSGRVSEARRPPRVLGGRPVSIGGRLIYV